MFRLCYKQDLIHHRLSVAVYLLLWCSYHLSDVKYDVSVCCFNAVNLLFAAISFSEISTLMLWGIASGWHCNQAKHFFLSNITIASW